MQVEVKPIPKKKWHGKSGAESFTQPRTIEALYDPKTGKYATGLTEKEVLEYGKKTGFDLSDNYSVLEPHPFWCSKAGSIKLFNRTNIFDDQKPMDFIRIKVMKASRFVANSQQELEDGLWPDAEFVIFDEKEEVTLQATKVQRKNKCVAIAAKLSMEEQLNILQILSDKPIKGINQSPDYITVEMDKVIEEKPDEFMRFAKMDKAEVYIRATILQALQRNVLNKEGGAIYYMGERLANDYEEAVEFFKDPQNSKMKVIILEKLNQK